MEYLSYKQLEIVEDLLQQIKSAILDIQQWNEKNNVWQGAWLGGGTLRYS